MYNLAIRKCTSSPLLAPRLKIFKLKFNTPPGIEPWTCWTRGRHATIWASAASMLTNKKSDSISFSGPNKVRYHELEQKVIVYYMREKRNEVCCRSHEKWHGLKYRTVLTDSMDNMAFKASAGWCVRMKKRAGLMLQHQTTLVQCLPAEELISFQCHVINLQKQHNYLLVQIGNADQTSIYLDTHWLRW